MAEIINLHTEGVEQLAKFFQALPEKMRKKHFRQALQKAATPILKEDRRLIKAEIPEVGTKSINKRGFTSEGQFTVVVGPDRRKGKDGKFGKGKAFHWFELGTKERFTSEGYSRGAIKPHRILERGFAAKVGEAERILRQELARRLVEEELGTFG